MTFGEEVRRNRKRHGYTLRDFASRVGIDFTYLSKIENDKGSPPAEDTIRRIAHELEMKGDELVLLANKLPLGMEEDFLNRPEDQVASMYRTLKHKTYTNEEWKAILELMKRTGN